MRDSHLLQGSLVCALSLAALGCREPNAVPQPVVLAHEAETPNAVETRSAVDRPSPEIKPWSRCNIESVDGMPFDPSEDARVGHRVSFGGWLAMAEGGVPGSAEIVLSRGEGEIVNTYPIVLSLARPDVAKAVGIEDPGVGFKVDIPLNGVSDGQYHLYITHRAGGGVLTCDNGRHVLVTNSANQDNRDQGT